MFDHGSQMVASVQPKLGEARAALKRGLGRGIRTHRAGAAGTARARQHRMRLPAMVDLVLEEVQQQAVAALDLDVAGRG